MIAAALFIAATSVSSGAWHPSRPLVASAWLGFSGATLSVTSVDDRLRSGTAHRTLKLSLPSGNTKSVDLHDGGGAAENQSLNLSAGEQDRFLLVSERDCIAVDPVRGAIAQCSKPAICSGRRTYVGRFDWMNGFDPPHGRFGLKWRFLPAYDAMESGGC